MLCRDFRNILKKSCGLILLLHVIDSIWSLLQLHEPVPQVQFDIIHQGLEALVKSGCIHRMIDVLYYTVYSKQYGASSEQTNTLIQCSLNLNSPFYKQALQHHIIACLLDLIGMYPTKIVLTEILSWTSAKKAKHDGDNLKPPPSALATQPLSPIGIEKLLIYLWVELEKQIPHHEQIHPSPEPSQEDNQTTFPKEYQVIMGAKLRLSQLQCPRYSRGQYQSVHTMLVCGCFPFL
jgi:hypothetical protein